MYPRKESISSVMSQHRMQFETAQVFLLDGLYYDAQNPDGVSDWAELDVMKKVPREKFLSMS